MLTVAITGSTIGIRIDKLEENFTNTNKDLMKLTCIAVLFSLLTVGTQAQPETMAHHRHISILSMKKEVFYFKVDADFIGATVEVTDSTGTVFFSAEVNSKRSLIDFFYLEKGKYTIHFERNGVIEDYQVWLDKKEGHDAPSFIAFKLQA